MMRLLRNDRTGWLAVALLSALVVSGCTTARRIPDSSSAAAIASVAAHRAQLVDLSMPLDETATFYPSLFPALGTQGVPVVEKFLPIHLGIRIFPGGSPFYYTAPEDGRSGHFTMGEHTGTHCDAANHFNSAGSDIVDVEPADMLRPFVIIDVRDAAATQHTLPVDTEMLRAWEQAHGQIPGGSLVFLLTGHEKQAGDSDIDHPGFTGDAAEFLRAERDIAGVGTDSLSPDISGALNFPVHKRLLGDECLILENLRNLSSLPATGAHVLLGIMPIADGSGAPTRAIALIDGESRGNFEVLDLSHKLDKKMPYLSGRDPLYSDLDIPIFDSLNMFDTKLAWLPKAVPIDRETTAKPLYHGYHNGYFSMGVTTGTHVTFPSRDVAGGADASGFPLDRLIAEVVVVDMSDVADNETLSRDGLFARIQEADLHGKVIILLTGRDGHGSRRGRLHPGIDAEGAAELMQRGVFGIATDSVEIDALAQEDRPAEKAVHAGGGFTACFLHDPGRLSTPGSIAAFLPLPIKGSGAAPARVLGYRPVQ